VQSTPLVPDDFKVPAGLSSELFFLEPLDVRHNEADYAAWTSSVDHIKATPGFTGPTWLDTPMSLAQNAADIAVHVQDFADRTRFVYTVLAPASGEVIGAVYLDPPQSAGCDVDGRSWVRADRAKLDKSLHDLVRHWLPEAWPFQKPYFVGR
jgi:hypothetical protein